MDFLEWNDAITTHFFRPEASGRTVYLYVTEDVIEQIGGQDSLREFVDVMIGGPGWTTRQGLCQRALQSLERWRSRSLQYPPYVGYLALFVLAAGIEGDFAPHAYYPRLRTLLGEPPTMGTYPSFGRMLELWSDLEQWLNHERGGMLGVLRTDIAGEWLHVGLPIAQAVLMLHSGVFVGRQYCTFAGITHGQKVHDFVEKLLAKRLASATTLGSQQRARLFHVHHKPLYAAIGESDNRHRKPVAIGRAIERLMILDGVLADPAITWLGAEREKRRYFIRRLGTSLEMDEYPRLVFGTPPNTTTRYFPDKLPIGVEPDSRRHVFLYLPTSPVPMDFRLFLLRHADLFHALGHWTIRLLFPCPFRSVMATFERAAYEQLANPLRISEVDELRWLFRQRQSATSNEPDADPARLAAASKAFRAPRFQALHRRWLEVGDRALWMAQSTAFRDALERREAHIESLVLPHSYMNLSALVGTA